MKPSSASTIAIPLSLCMALSLSLSLILYTYWKLTLLQRVYWPFNQSNGVIRLRKRGSWCWRSTRGTLSPSNRKTVTTWSRETVCRQWHYLNRPAEPPVFHIHLWWVPLGRVRRGRLARSAKPIKRSANQTTALDRSSAACLGRVESHGQGGAGRVRADGLRPIAAHPGLFDSRSARTIRDRWEP